MFKESKGNVMASNKKQESMNVSCYSIQCTITASVENNEQSIVKFKIDKEVFATSVKISTKFEDIKKSLAEVLNLEEHLIIFEKDNGEVEMSSTLTDLGVQPYTKITLNLKSTKGNEGMTLITERVREYIPTVDVITVHLREGAGDYRDLVVEIENHFCQKEWLGGYRNRLTNIKYHHATTQTHPKKRKVFELSESGETIPLLYHRDTQTVLKPKDVANDTVVDKATQMWRSDLYIAAKSDKIKTARPYLSYDDWYQKNNNENAVITIQRAVRNWSHGKKIKNIIKLQKTLREELIKQNRQILNEQLDKEREIITSAAYPVKRDDFYMLYLMVGNWWKREWKRISVLRTAESKKAEGVSLLEEEVRLLQEIEKHRILGKKEALKKERLRFLEQTSRPLTFKNSKGQMTSIDDIETQKAREYKEIYSALTTKDILPKDRIEILFALKQLFVSHFPHYEYATDLVSLIDREVNLLCMGIKERDLKGLRTRIEQLYVNFLQQKEFNPKAAKYKKPNTPKTLHAMFRCNRCLKLLPASKFPVHVRMTAYTECQSCVWLQNIGHQRIDMSPFLKLLKYVQNAEMQKCCYSAVCFIMQPIGMGYLTQVIWHGHSAISECHDLSKLQHIRWLPDVEWAPWNTILLTDQEAKCHACIPDVFQFYGPKFVENIRQKHILGRKRFIHLLKMDHDIRTSGVWSTVTNSGQFLHNEDIEMFAAEKEEDAM